MSIRRTFMKTLFGDELSVGSQPSMLRYGLTLLCIVAPVFYIAFAVYLGVMHVTLMFGYMVAMSVVSLALIPLCRLGYNKTVFLLSAAGVVALHLLNCYFIGGANTLLIVVVAMLPNHLFPILRRMRWRVLYDLVLMLAIVAGELLIALTPHSYAHVNSCLFTLLVTLSCLILMFLVLFASDWWQSSIDRHRNAMLARNMTEAMTDALTGLGNRRMFAARKHVFEQAAHTGPVSVAILDLDLFKAVNDTYGHDIGDVVLRHIAALIESSFRRSDMLLRWGGEEFVVVLRDVDRDGTRILFEDFSDKLRANPASSGELTIPVTLTVGVYQHVPGTPLEDSIRRADLLMYQGKIDGRDRVMA